MEPQTKREPSAPKASRVPPVNKEIGDKEIEELFKAKAPGPEEPVHDQFDSFIRSTARSKIAVIVPLYGYWGDVHGFLKEDTISSAMVNVTSTAHTWYTVVVAESQRMSHGVYATIAGYNTGGNMRGVDVPVGSSYADYVAKGIEVALDETDAQYIIVYNPWGVIQRHGIDILVDRVNLNGNAPVICGYDLQAELQADQFSSYKATQPREFASYRAKHLLSFNFIGMRRFIAEMCSVDPRFKTQPFAERDFFQQIAMKNFDAVTSERVPIYTFKVPWHDYVPDEWYEDDLQEFVKKWGFTPGDIKVRS